MPSVSENIANHSNDIEAEVMRMQELMAKSKTGIKMLEQSQQMAMSEEMMGLMEKIGDPQIPEDERMTLARYMGEMLQDDPVDGLEDFAQYLEEVLQDPQYASRSEYYTSIAASARAVNATEVYKEYIKAYQIFENDPTPEAKAARVATEEMQEKMKAWAEGGE